MGWSTPLPPPGWTPVGPRPVWSSSARAPTKAPRASPTVTAPARTAFAARRRRARPRTPRGIRGSRRISSAFSSSIVFRSTSPTPRDLRPEPVQAPRHQRLHRANRAAEDLGGLRLCQVLVVSEDDGHPLPRLEAVGRVPPLLPAGGVRRGNVRRPTLSLHVGPPHPPAAEVGARHVHHRGPEVGAERLGMAEVPEPTE